MGNGELIMSDDSQYNGRISLLINDDETTIEIYDEVSRECIVVVTLTPEQICTALSRLCRTECTIRVGNLERVGKKLLIDHLIFPMPEYSFNNKKEIASKEALRLCPEGWLPDNYFGSQNSFFVKDVKTYARTTIRKWVSMADEGLASWEDQCNQN